MKIVIPVIDFGRGGGYRVLSQLASEWSRNVETMLLAPADAGAPYYPTEAMVQYASWWKSTECPGGASSRGARKVAYAQVALRRGLHRVVRSGDVVLTNHFLTCLAAEGLENRGAVPIRLMQAEEAEYHRGLGPRSQVLRALALRADRKAPHVLVNSPTFLSGDSRRVAVVPPGIDLSVFHPRARGPRNHVPIVGTIGRAEPWKGTERVLEALELVGAQMTLDVSIANFGYQRIRKSQIPITEVLPKGDEELAAWYRGLDMYVVGVEGQTGSYHYPCLEALACGVTLVTPDFKPADRNTAWIAPTSSPPDLATTVMRALKNHNAQKTEAGLNEARKFDWKAVSRIALEAIDGLLQDLA